LIGLTGRSIAAAYLPAGGRQFCDSVIAAAALSSGRATLKLAGFAGEFEMELEFLFQVAIRWVAAERAPQTTQQFTDRSHGRL
jgi:hypothetical protein